MSALTVYYDGREIGQINQWRLDGKHLTLKGNPLGFLTGMVIELEAPAVDAAATLRTGALVGQASASSALIHLDKLTAFDAE